MEFRFRLKNARKKAGILYGRTESLLRHTANRFRGAYKKKTLRCYRTVDAGNINALIELFAENIHYRRGNREISGRAALIDFYRHVRDISGRHEIISLAAKGNTITVKGRFIGQRRNGEQLDFLFTDFFVFNAKGLIEKRVTDTGNVNV